MTPVEDPSGLLSRALQDVLKRYEPAANATSIDPWRKYAGNLAGFAQDVLKAKLWAFQRRLFSALLEHKYVAVSGGRRVSKTETVSTLVPAFIYTQESIALTTGPGGRQVKMQMWQRIAKVVEGARLRGVPLPGEMNAADLQIGPDHYALGMSTTARAGEHDAGRIRGFHSGVIVPDDPDAPLTVDELERMRAQAKGAAHPLLIVIDEATAVDPAIFRALEGSMQGDTYVLLLMNPTLESESPHPAVQAFKPGSRFYRIRVTQLTEEEDIGDDSGLVFDEVFRAPAWLRNPKWIEAQRRYGIGSPEWCADVSGRFPRTGIERRFVTFDMLSACEHLEFEEAADGSDRHIGADIARSTDGDESIAVLNIAGRVAAIHSWRSSDLMETAGILLSLQRAWAIDKSNPIPGRNVHIDSIGVGGGVVDRMRQLGQSVDAVDVGAAPCGDWRDLVGEQQFLNRKAELQWVARRLHQEQRAAIPPKYEDLRRQIQWTRYDFAAKAGGTVVRVHAEDDKEGLRSRYGRSPDHAEAYFLSLSRTGSTPQILLMTPSPRIGRLVRPQRFGPR